MIIEDIFVFVIEFCLDGVVCLKSKDKGFKERKKAADFYFLILGIAWTYRPSAQYRHTINATIVFSVYHSTFSVDLDLDNARAVVCSF